MNCVVTGASGFIGSALIKRLNHEGHHVRAVLHTKPPTKSEQNIEYINADLTDFSTLATIVHAGDIVIHCAALVKDYGSEKEIINVNLNGTKHLVRACHNKISRFIFLSHLHSTSGKKIGAYSSSKGLAEQYLLQEYNENQFPAVIIRPGSVFGPKATTWCLRPLQAIQQDHIALINHGTGLFLHTYIDNLIDGLVLSFTAPHLEGETIEITDGDNTTTWKTYLNDLAHLAGKPPIQQNISPTIATMLSHAMMLRYHLFHTPPLLTPTAVHLFTNKQTVSLEKARRLLRYTPKIGYSEAMKQIEQWLRQDHYI